MCAGKVEAYWMKLDGRVCGFISEQIDGIIIHHVEEMSTTYGVWLKLDVVYARKMAENKVQLVRKLTNMEYVDGSKIVAAVASRILNCLVTRGANSAAIHQSKHMTISTKDHQKLQKMRAKLVAQVTHVEVNTNEMKQGGLHRNQVEKWLTDVKKSLDEIDAVEYKVKGEKRCLGGLLPTCCSRTDPGQCISELIKEVTSLLEVGAELLALPVSEIGMELPTREPVGETTAQKTLKMVWECLMDDKTEVTGVYGMGGVGKTTIMKVVNNRLLEERHSFSKVIWVTISKEVNIYRLQDEIAKEVGLYLSPKQDEVKRSSLLHKELLGREKYVFILDDMWEAFPLEKIGIPDFTEENGSKLVLTSRSLEVCQMMGCKKFIRVEPLTELEAWELFMRTISTELAPEVEKIAKDVSKECSGLPLAILTIGGAMRGKEDIREWRGALNDLRRSTYWIVDLEEKVIERLKFSYSRLGDDTLKKCFVYCALCPEDYEIDSEELIDLWFMEGLICGRSIQAELDHGRDILNNLFQCCLLEHNSKYDDEGLLRIYVKMHDLIRDMALHITKTNPGFMVKAGVSMEKLGDEMNWRDDYEKVSFMRSRLHEILISPNCSGLKTLLLNENPSLHHILGDFFSQMQGLRVLNLSNIAIELLPESISHLINLQVLDLSWCKELKKIHSLEKLHLLRVLRLSYTPIEELPPGMEALVNLKRLDLTDTKLKEFPSHLIYKLSLLQELLMPSLRISNFTGNELLSLSHLESLSIRFPYFSEYIFYSNSENFKHLNYFSFGIGDPILFNIPMSKQNRSRGVSICNDSTQSLSNVILPQKTEYLCLEKFDDVTRLSKLARSNDMRDLRSCKIKFCNELIYVLVSEDDSYLQHLEKLEISSCEKLINLYEGVPSSGTLPCLRRLEIWFCDNLTYLFSSKLFKQLQNLVDVDVTYSDKMEQLIVLSEEKEDEEEGSGVSSTITSSLKTLKLMHLAHLKTLFSQSTLHCFQNIEEVRINDCEEMEDLMAEEESAISEKSSSSDNHATFILPKLKKLHLGDLPKLRSICNGYLPHLKKLVVLDCHKLMSIYKGVPFYGGLPCLKKLVIKRCDNLKYLFSFALFKHLQNLVEVDIEYCQEIEELIVTAEEEVTSEAEFTTAASTTSSFKKLHLFVLPKMKTLFSKNMLHYFQNLEDLRIVSCGGMEELIAAEGQVMSEISGTSSNDPAIRLPKLKKMYLGHLPKLTSVWKGVMVCDSIQTVEIDTCYELKRLPKLSGQEQFPPPSLKKIRGSREWWDSLEEDHSYLQNIFQPFY